MASWLLGFVFGVIGGRAVSSLELREPLVIVSFLAVVGGGFWLWKRYKFSIFSLALFWGFANAAPTLQQTGDEAKVVRSDSVYASPRPVLIEVSGKLFQAFAPSGATRQGSLRFKPMASGLGVGRSSFLTAPDLLHSGGPESGLFATAVARLRAWFHSRLQAERPFMRRWLSGILLGERAALPMKVVTAFKSTGTYHLLAVSGLHVSLLVAAMSLALRWPFQMAYALRLIRPATWQQLASGLNILAAMLAIIYLAVAGMPVGAQRSVLTYLVVQLGAVSWGIPPLKKRLLLAVTLQTLCFPIGFVSEGALMSWGAYLLVVRGLEGRLFRVQAQLAIMAAAAFGQLPILGILANLLLVPVFSLLLVLGLAAVTLGSLLPGRAVILAMHASFIEIVLGLGQLTADYPWLAITADRLPLFCRVIFWIASAYFLLNTCRNLSIDHNEEEDS